MNSPLNWVLCNALVSGLFVASGRVLTERNFQKQINQITDLSKDELKLAESANEKRLVFERVSERTATLFHPKPKIPVLFSAIYVMGLLGLIVSIVASGIHFQWRELGATIIIAAISMLWRIRSSSLVGWRVGR